MGKDLASQIQSSSLKQQDLTRRHLDEVELTRMEAGDIIKKFVKHWDKRLCRVDTVTSTELSSALEDFIDECREARGESAAGVGFPVGAPHTPQRGRASTDAAQARPRLGRLRGRPWAPRLRRQLHREERHRGVATQW